MKIAHIVCVYPPYRGGIGKSAEDFALMMAEEGHEVTVCTPEYFHASNQSKELENKQANIKLRKIKPFFKIGNGAFIPSILFELHNFDLLYLHYPFFGGAEIVWFFKIFNKKTKLIVHYHMDVVGLPLFLRLLSWPSKLIRNSLMNKAALLTAASFDYVLSSQIGNYYKKNKNKFRETYFPVDLNKFLPREERIPREKKEILFVGGLDRAHYFKGLDVLLDSLLLLKSREDWILKVVGDGDLKKNYIKKCQQNGLEKKVFFLGLLSSDNLYKTYRESDFFVLPSINRGEAFGIVLLEAMASGLPVIASDLPGVRSVFTDQEGFTAAPGDKKDLAKKISVLLDDENLLMTMSNKARKLVENKYSREKISRRIKKIIEEL